MTGVFEMDALDLLIAKANRLEQMIMNSMAPTNPSYDVYGRGHQSSECSIFNQDFLVDHMANVNCNGFNQHCFDEPYSNTYNLGWHDHPNFSWKNPQPYTQNFYQNNIPPDFSYQNFSPQFIQNQLPPQPQNSHLEELLENFILAQTKRNEDEMAQIQQLASDIEEIHAHSKMLENQIVQLVPNTPQRNDEEPLSQPDSNFFEEALAILMRYEEQVEMQGQDEEMQGQDSSITVEEKPIQPIEDCSNIDTVKVIVEELQDQPEDSLKATSVDAYTSNKEDTNRVAHGLDKVEEVSMDLNEFVKSKHEEWVAIHEPSVEDSYEEELKPSPTHFNFAFIREAETLNIIFSAALSEVHKCNLFKVFWGPKETFRWKFHRWRWKDKKSHE